MAPPNESTVEALCSAALIGLRSVPDASASEIMSALLTLTARLTHVVVETPNSNIDALRAGLLHIWNILPAEEVVLH